MVEKGPDEKEVKFDPERGAFMARRLLEEHFLPPAEEYVARQPCPDCNTTEARLIRRNGQATVRCAWCDRHLYNAPRTETGERVHSMETVRRGLKPSQQARIFERDLQRCILCGRGAESVPLTIEHLVSIKEGLALGLTDAELNDDRNLAAMCEACNAGLYERSINVRTLLRLHAAALRAEIARDTSQKLQSFT